jgi:hypothetical protein
LFAFFLAAFYTIKIVFLKRKNALIINVKDFVSSFNNSFTQLSEKYLSANLLNSIARKTGFLKREKKLSPLMFLSSLVCADLSQCKISLLNLKGEIQEQFHCSISREGLHKRFTQAAVDFLRTTFVRLLWESSAQELGNNITSSKFNRITIKDSTKFRLDKTLIDQYPGYKSFKKEYSLMNIQYEFDIISGNWLSTELTKATRNDQLDSRETIKDIEKNDLCIRDLGYVTMPYLKGVINAEAYFLNRLPPKMGTFQIKNGKLQPVDWGKIHSLMQRRSLPHLAIDVFLDKKMTVKVRMIIEAVPEQIAQKRINDATVAGKRKDGYTPTKEYKIKSHYNIFITNAPEEKMPLAEASTYYRLRWQIELIFKTWKSLASIDKVKKVKKERFECQLYARLIWILLNWKIFQVIDYCIKKAAPKEGCSVQKFFNMVNKQSFSLRNILGKLRNIKRWFKEVLIPLIPDLIIERKLKKPTHKQILNDLCQC